MEKRRLQATGGSSLTLTLPKAWLERWKLKSKDEVLVNVVGSSLIIKPAGRSRLLTARSINLDDKAPQWVQREIIGAYINGLDKIVLEAKQITPQQNQIVRQTVQLLFGFEILEETSTIIVARNVTDNALFPVAESARRIFAISRSMFEDALRAAQTGDKELAHDIVLRDHEVNKFAYAIKRRFVQIINGCAEGNPIEVDYYRSVASRLERVGDRAVSIAELATNNQTGQVMLSSSFPKIRTAMTDLLDQIEELLNKPNIKLAHKILDQNNKLEPLMYSSTRMKQSYEGGIIEFNLDRLRGHLMNISELTVDYLMQS